MTVTSQKETVINLDGEVYPAKEVTFQVIPGFVRFLLPRGSSLPQNTEEDAKKEPAMAGKQ